jgi:hypothetical protein
MTQVIAPHAAGIDVGSTEMYVAVPVDRDPQSVRRFSTFTNDLIRLAGLAAKCRITSVAMESTQTICGIRSIWRHRESLVAGDFVLTA